MKFISIVILLSFCTFSRLRAAEIGFSKQQFSFMENIGQVKDTDGKPRPDIRFTAEANGVKLFFQKDKVSYVYAREKAGQTDAVELYRLDFCFSALRSVEIVGKFKINSHTNFYLADVGKNEDNIAKEYAEIIYKNVKKGIDLRFYWNEGVMKYDWIVKDPLDIPEVTFWYEGESSIEILEGGTMEILHPMGKLTEGIPVSFQGSKFIFTEYGFQQLEGGFFHYKIASFEPGEPITIDPTVIWSTYFGGSGTENSRLYSDVVTDVLGNVYFTGHTQSTNFPVSVGAFQTVYGGPVNDAYIVKLDSNGQRVWATYFGGSQFDVGTGIQVDAQGNVFITGISSSTNLPVSSGCYQPLLGGVQDAFLAKFSNSGGRLWATYFGGNDIDEAYRLRLTSAGNPVLAGATFSSNFPVTPGAHQATSRGGYDAFFSRFSSQGTLSWSTLLGGATDDYCYGFGLDASDNLLFAGQTNSSNLAISPGAFQGTLGGSNDGMAGKFSANGSLVWLTYIGGTTNDDFTCATVDAAGNLYAGGKTFSNNYPVSPGAFQTTYNAVTHAGVLAKFSANGVRLWATYFSGGTLDRILDMEIAASGLLAFTGETRGGVSFPVTVDAMYSTLQGGIFDAFLTKFTPGGSVYYSSFYGSAGSEYGRGIGVSQNGNIILLGATESTTHPVTVGAFQSTFGGPTMDAFVTRLGDCPLMSPNLNQADTAYFCAGSNLTITAQNSYPTYLWSTGSSSNSIVVTLPGMYSVTVTHASGCQGWDSVFVVQRPFPTAGITPLGPVTICSNRDTTLTATVGDQYRWYRNGVLISGANASSYHASLAGSYTVVVENFGGCRDSTSIPVIISTLPAPSPNLGPDPELCPGTSATLDAGAGFSSYAWCNSLGTGQTISVSNAGIYCVSVTAANGCSGSDTIVVTVTPVTVNFSWAYGATTQQLVFTNLSSVGSAWAWDFGDGGTATQQHTTHTYTSLDTHVVVCMTLFFGNGCDSTVCDTIPLGALGISENNIKKWQIYPNPFKNKIQISGIHGECSIEILDLNGRSVVSQNFWHAQSNTIELDLSALPNSVYLVKIQTQEELEFVKISKQE